MVDITEIAENIYLIDDELYSLQGWGCVYLLNEEKKALIDTGPTNSIPLILEGMKKVGITVEDIHYLMATHVHLDHTGGAGALLKIMPQAQLVVHQRGAKHLINPTKLVSSMIAVQGEETLKQLGEVVPAAPGRVRSMGEGDAIDLSCEQILRILDAPGHAPHELCIHESRNNGVFTGDAAGMFLGNGASFALTPPPSFDAEVCLNTLKRLAQLEPSWIYFAHFGATTRVQEHLQTVMEELRTAGKTVTRAVKANKLDRLAEKLIAQKTAQLAPIKPITALSKFVAEQVIPMNVAGYLKYYQEKYGVALS